MEYVSKLQAAILEQYTFAHHRTPARIFSVKIYGKKLRCSFEKILHICELFASFFCTIIVLI